MPDVTLLDAPLSPAEVARIARGGRLALSPAAEGRLAAAHGIVTAIVAGGIRGYGINTGVGALCDVIIPAEEQSRLSLALLMSHSCGVGAPLPVAEARAIMAAQVNNFAHGYSGLRPEIVATLIEFLNAGVTPVIPSKGSVGYITHAAAIALVLIGQGEALWQGERITGARALEIIGRPVLVPGPKEGLSLINGVPCATGLACLAVDRLTRLVDWADAAAGLTYGVLGRQRDAFAEAPMRLRQSPGLWETASRLRRALGGGDVVAARTQDPMSLRAVPQVHGAVRDALAGIHEVVARELASVTDNPVVAGSEAAPQVWSHAHTLAVPLAFAMDHLALAAAQLAAIAERRIDRLVNPLVSGLPAFLTAEGGVGSGFMIAQYTAVALCGENRRLAAPASLDGGVTSALQEDILPHTTPAAEKALRVLDNLETVLGIELLCAAQAHDLTPGITRGPWARRLHARIRARVAPYADDRPLNGDFTAIAPLLAETVEETNK